jgi:thiosulfate/3-mercaptopyruvate sulfurtransferase
LSPRKINRISVALLGVGFVAALVVFFAMPPDPDDNPLLDQMHGRSYERQMRLIGGKANLASAEIVDGFLDLWRGRELAGTLAVVTVAGTLLFRFVASHPDSTPASSIVSDDRQHPVLVDTAQLSRHLADSSWIIFDCRHDTNDHLRGARVYGESHLPGARFAPMETALSGAKTGSNGRHPLPTAADFAAFLSGQGVTAETQLVAYDDAGGQYAARFWWLARWIGLTRVAVLDGGWPKWLADGFPISRAIPPARVGSVVARPDASQVREVAAVIAALAADECLVLDARAPERFRGEVEPVDRIAGRIPSARNRFFKENLNADQTLRPKAELRREFEALLGGRAPAQVVHQCGSGVTACVNLLAMEHAGLTGSKLYAGSWSEWIADPGRPIARGAA